MEAARAAGKMPDLLQLACSQDAEDAGPGLAAASMLCPSAAVSLVPPAADAAVTLTVQPLATQVCLQCVQSHGGFCPLPRLKLLLH